MQRSQDWSHWGACNQPLGADSDAAFVATCGSCASVLADLAFLSTLRMRGRSLGTGSIGFRGWGYNLGTDLAMERHSCV